MRELAEAGDDSKGGDGDAKRKRPKKPSTADANDSPSPKGDVPTGPRADVDSDPDSNEASADASAGVDDPGDDDGIDAAGEAGEEPSGAINNEVSGKIVQAVTIEPHSKVLPGAKEVVLSFNDSTDALRVLVTATGRVAFFWRGQLHDIP